MIFCGTPEMTDPPGFLHEKFLGNYFFIQEVMIMFALPINQTIMKLSRPVTRKSITPAQFRNFIFAGRSVFTLENNETGNYITFKIKELKKNYKVIPGVFVVECKVLGDKDTGYRFLGFLNLNERKFRRRFWDHNFIGYTTLFWLLKNLENLEKYEKLSIYHEGRCCKCGMPLTVPESIDSGIGPECNKRMLEKSIQKMKDLGTWNDAMTYDDNVRLALKTDPSLWSELHVPDHIKPEQDFAAHRLLARLDIF